MVVLTKERVSTALNIQVGKIMLLPQSAVKYFGPMIGTIMSFLELIGSNTD